MFYLNSHIYLIWTPEASSSLSTIVLCDPYNEVIMRSGDAFDFLNTCLLEGIRLGGGMSKS